MILLTRRDGTRFAINADAIERVDETPDTVVTLQNGNVYLVAETLEEVIDRVAEFAVRAQGELGVRVASNRPRPRPRTRRRQADHLSLATDHDAPDPAAPPSPDRTTRRLD